MTRHLLAAPVLLLLGCAHPVPPEVAAAEAAAEASLPTPQAQRSAAYTAAAHARRHESIRHLEAMLGIEGLPEAGEHLTER